MNFVFFDLETQKLFQDVGGRDASKLRLACGVTYSTDKKDFTVYWERDAQALVNELKAADKVIGFNIKEFDYEVLRPYAPTFNFASLRTLDLLLELSRILSFRIPFDSACEGMSQCAEKTADGIQSVEWFRNGELDKVAEYCKADVDITRRVYEFGRDNGFVYYYSEVGKQIKGQCKLEVKSCHCGRSEAISCLWLDEIATSRCALLAMRSRKIKWKKQNSMVSILPMSAADAVNHWF